MTATFPLVSFNFPSPSDEIVSRVYMIPTRLFSEPFEPNCLDFKRERDCRVHHHGLARIRCSAPFPNFLRIRSKIRRSCFVRTPAASSIVVACSRKILVTSARPFALSSTMRTRRSSVFFRFKSAFFSSSEALGEAKKRISAISEESDSAGQTWTNRSLKARLRSALF